MTKAELQSLTTEILDGFEMSQSLFDAFLDVAQTTREGERNWVSLRSSDATQSLGASNTYTTAHTIPSTFASWYATSPVVLTNASGARQELQEIPIDKRDQYKNDPNKFYCDYVNNKIYICGTFSEAMTINQYFKKEGTLVSADDANTWIFPDRYHKMLAFDIAVMHKLGIDYDVINNIQANENASIANRLFKQMEEWDNELQLSALNGQEY